MADAIVIMGACLEVIGVFLMAGAYLSAARPNPWDRLQVLVSAFFRGDAAKGAVDMSELNATHKVQALQGLAFIGLGFVCQASAMIWKYFS